MSYDSPEDRRAAAAYFMATATQSVLETMLPQIVDSRDLPISPAQREELLAALSTGGWMDIFRAKVVHAMTRFLTAPEIEALTRYFSNQPPELRDALLKGAFAQRYIAIEIGDWVEQEYTRRFESGQQ